MRGILGIFTDPVFTHAGGEAKNRLQAIENSSYQHYYRALIAGFLIANQAEKKAQYEEAIHEMEKYTEDPTQEGFTSNTGQFFPKGDPIPIYLWLRFFKRQESMFSNPAGVVYILPAIQFIAWITSMLMYFGAHVPAMMWSLSFFHITGISILTALTLPMAILTGMAWYHALFIPTAPQDKSRIASWEALLFTGILVGTYFFPPLLAILSGLFTAVFFYQRYAKIPEFNTILTYLVKGTEADAKPKPFIPDWITGLASDDDLQNMSSLSRRSRQRFQLGVFYFFAASAWVLLRPLSLPALFASMPVFTGIFVGVITIVALCAVILPWRHALFPPKAWTQPPTTPQHPLAASVLCNMTEGRAASREKFDSIIAQAPISGR